MKITLRTDKDEEYDNCGKATLAVLHIGSIKIPLCSDCLNDLKKDIDKITNMRFCGRCKHITWSKKYHDRASCNLQGDIRDEDIGYVRDVFYFDACPYCRGVNYEPEDNEQ